MQTANSVSAANRRLRFHWFALRIVVTTLGLLSMTLFSSLVVSLLAQETRPQAKKEHPHQAAPWNAALPRG
jgi:hypothetical protein